MISASEQSLYNSGDSPNFPLEKILALTPGVLIEWKIYNLSISMSGPGHL